MGADFYKHLKICMYEASSLAEGGGSSRERFFLSMARVVGKCIGRCRYLSLYSFVDAVMMDTFKELC